MNQKIFMKKSIYLILVHLHMQMIYLILFLQICKNWTTYWNLSCDL